MKTGHRLDTNRNKNITMSSQLLGMAVVMTVAIPTLVVMGVSKTIQSYLRYKQK
jgi:hypothetical protein